MVCAADNQIFYINIKGIAVVEAKDNKHAVGGGIQQAIDYAQILDLKFAYSSNGDAFLEHIWCLLQEMILIKKL